MEQHLPEQTVTYLWRLLMSLLSLFLVQLGWNFNMLVSDLGGVNWLWPFMVLSQIYGCSNFSHNFCQLTLLARFMAKIWDAINLAEYHKWPKPVYSPKVWHQHIKISAQLHVIEAQKRHEKSPQKRTTPQARCGSSGGLLIYDIDSLFK